MRVSPDTKFTLSLLSISFLSRAVAAGRGGGGRGKAPPSSSSSPPFRFFRPIIDAHARTRFPEFIYFVSHANECGEEEEEGGGVRKGGFLASGGAFLIMLKRLLPPPPLFPFLLPLKGRSWNMREGTREYGSSDRFFSPASVLHSVMRRWLPLVVGVEAGGPMFGYTYLFGRFCKRRGLFLLVR